MWCSKHRFIKFWPHHNCCSALLQLPVPRYQSVLSCGQRQRCFFGAVAGKSIKMRNNGVGGPRNRTIHLANGKSEGLTEGLNQRYQAAVCQLNRLQSNAVTLAKHHGTEEKRFVDTWKYLKRSGLTEEQLDSLPVIHVAGTKGKGSVCSFVESILREHGLRTGFFSSPHLVSVTERIRLNGVPISEESFAGHFWKLFNRLNASKESTDDLPPYFKFLTLMAFHAFLAERVDVAIVEVGIGGKFDCTNIVRGTRTVGITSLGLDHVQVLGDTIEKIACQKAGIIKRQSHVFTVGQPGRANAVIEEVARANEASLTVVPPFDAYSWSRQPDLNLTNNSVHKLNISLAIQLSLDWMVQQGMMPPNQSRRHCTEQMIAGIEKFNWPGRYQVIVQGQNRFYLDGAHTLESIEACLEWFHETSRRQAKRDSLKCLLFFVTGTRDVESLARPILEKECFDLILICPNVVDTQATIMDNVTANVNSSDLERKCQNIGETFQRMSRNKVPVEVLSSVSDALRAVDALDGGREKDVLITGSLYLVGTALISLNHTTPKGRDN